MEENKKFKLNFFNKTTLKMVGVLLMILQRLRCYSMVMKTVCNRFRNACAGVFCRGISYW